MVIISNKIINNIFLTYFPNRRLSRFVTVPVQKNGNSNISDGTRPIAFMSLGQHVLTFITYYQYTVYSVEQPGFRKGSSTR